MSVSEAPPPRSPANFCRQAADLVRVRSLSCTRNGRSRHFRQKNTYVLAQFPSDPLPGLLWPRCLPDASQMSPRCLPDASQFPPSPGCVQDSPDPGAQRKNIFWLFCDLKKWPSKVEPKVSKWSPQLTKNRSKIDKMLALEPVLKKRWKNDEKPCLWILKNSGFAWQGLHFSRFPVSSKSWENYSRNCLKMTPKSFKKWFEGFPKM